MSALKNAVLFLLKQHEDHGNPGIAHLAQRLRLDFESEPAAEQIPGTILETNFQLGGTVTEAQVEKIVKEMLRNNNSLPGLAFHPDAFKLVMPPAGGSTTGEISGDVVQMTLTGDSLTPGPGFTSESPK